MSRNERVLFPFLALLLTLGASLLFLFEPAISIFSLLRRQAAPNFLPPSWLNYCFVHLFLLKKLSLIGLGCTVLGTALTLFLVLRTESLEAAYRHLIGMGLAALMTTLLFTLPLFFLVITSGGMKRNPSLLPILGAGAVGMGCFFFLSVSFFFCFIQICGRLKEQSETMS